VRNPYVQCITFLDLAMRYQVLLYFTGLLIPATSQKSMGPDGIHPRVLRDLAKPLSTINTPGLQGRIASVTPSARKSGRRILSA